MIILSHMTDADALGGVDLDHHKEIDTFRDDVRARFAEFDRYDRQASVGIVQMQTSNERRQLLSTRIKLFSSFVLGVQSTTITQLPDEIRDVLNKNTVNSFIDFDHQTGVLNSPFEQIILNRPDGVHENIIVAPTGPSKAGMIRGNVFFRKSDSDPWQVAGGNHDYFTSELLTTILK